ncbi:hypothetical protein LJC49_03735 [Ruminococcaceae bacterium OttesenSCG-928-I18]|nr:hypothetical protein [Ruminococcaceae bacterium OttesenSCG-928-I18]
MRELVVTNLPFTCPRGELAKKLHTQKCDELYEQAMDILQEVEDHIHPCYLVKEFRVDTVDRDGFVIDGCRFSSKIAAHKLNGAQSVLLFIASCGAEIGKILDETEDELDRYILDQISYLAYLEANKRLIEAVHRQWGIDQFIRLCPGSVIDWSVGDVCLFFKLLEGKGLYEQLGVRVLESGLIDPLKSSSGLFHVTEEEFESCSICPRQNCEGRREAFDLELHDQMVRL